jgi:hypothetical protein
LAVQCPPPPARPPRRLVAITGLCVLAAALLTGCGSSPKPLSKSAYDARMVTIGRGLANDLNPLAAASSAHAAQLALGVLQRELGDADKQLSAITPPLAVKADQARLVAAVASFAAELGPVIAKLAAGDLSSLATVYSLKGLLEIQAAARAITGAGYKINS